MHLTMSRTVGRIGAIGTESNGVFRHNYMCVIRAAESVLNILGLTAKPLLINREKLASVDALV